MQNLLIKFRTHSKLFISLAIIIIALTVPLTVFLVQKQQEIRSRASISTVLYFTPDSSADSPIKKGVGDTFTLDIVMDPGQNQVIHTTLDINYDPTKLATSDAGFVIPPDATLNSVVVSPRYTEGNAFLVVSAGTDLTKIVIKPTKIASITFKTLAPTGDSPAQITYGPKTTVTATIENPEASVLSSTKPAFITIAGAVTATPTPTLTLTTPTITPPCIPKPACLDSTPPCLIAQPAQGWCPNITSVPTPTSTLTPTLTPTPSPTPIPITPTPKICQNDSDCTAGEICQNNTCVQKYPKLFLDLVFPGIGLNGNSNPVHKNPDITVCLYDPNVNPTGDNNCSKAILKKLGPVIYDSISGHFINNNFDLGNFNQEGQYLILIKSDKYLRKQLPQLLNIAREKINKVPELTLIVGDINNDNLLNIADYNIYKSCFGDKTNTSECINKENSDLNDDGKNDTRIDLSDFRLLFASFQTQSGD